MTFEQYLQKQKAADLELRRFALALVASIESKWELPRTVLPRAERREVEYRPPNVTLTTDIKA